MTTSFHSRKSRYSTTTDNGKATKMTKRHIDGEAYLSNDLDYEAEAKGRGMVRILLIAVAVACGLIGAWSRSLKEYS